jgi:hypothetical protein
MSEELKPQDQVTEEVVDQKEPGPVSVDDGVIKVNLSELNKPQEDAVQEQSADASDDAVGQPEDTPSSEEVVEEVREPVQNEETSIQAEESVLQEITEEEVQEKTEELEEQVEQALVEADAGIELPENIQKVVEFINETGGTLEDYVKLNTDYSSLNEKQLLKEYYETTRPHLESDEISFLMEDNFSYDEELDEERDIRKKKIAYKEELAKAKSHLEGLKSKYYDEIKAGSRLNPDQQKAVEFFNRYNKEKEANLKQAEQQSSIFNKKTESVFSKDFKGFDFNVGEKKFRFKVNNIDEVKTTQGDINNFVKKFLNEKNEMSDAAGYHKSLFTAMNADTVAQHFYEQGKADAMRGSIEKSKNIDMEPRGTHEKVKASNGWSVRSVSGGDSASFKIKTRR